MVSPARIPIIIVGYRNPADVIGCVRALCRLDEHPAFDVYVCENGGPAAFEALASILTDAGGLCEPGSMDAMHDPMPRFVRVRSFCLGCREAQITIAEAIENLGYAGAVNAWLRILMGMPDWCGVWVLNPDTEPEPRALAELVASSAQRGRGMVGSRILPFRQPDFIESRGLSWRRLRASTLAVDGGAPAVIEPAPAQVEARLHAPAGPSMYVTRQCLNCIGLMEEMYFLYYEDLDWGYRAKRCCGIGYAHNSVIRNRGGTTIGSGTRRTASRFSVYLEFRNRINFVRRHHRSWLLWTVAILTLRTLEYCAVGAFSNFLAACYGVKAGLVGETGRPDRIFDFAGVTPTLRRSGAGRPTPRQP